MYMTLQPALSVFPVVIAINRHSYYTTMRK